MHLSQVTLLLLAATGALATPLGQDLEARDSDILLSSKKTNEGEGFEVWGRAVDARDEDTLFKSDTTPNGGSFEAWGKRQAQALTERKTKCASGVSPVCDDKNGGPNTLCLSLISYLSSFSSQTTPKGSKALCYTGADGKCCTKWNTNIKYLTYGDLVPNAQTMYSSCSGSSGNSGKMNGVRLHGTCANQCLNNGHSCK